MNGTPLRVTLWGESDRVLALRELILAAGNEVGEGGEVSFVDVATAELRAFVRARGLGPRPGSSWSIEGWSPPAARSPSTLVTGESACVRVGVLAGPIVPGEVKRKSPCAAVVASDYSEVQRLGARALHSPLCRVYPTDDRVGVELAGALVDVVAAALGAARGLGLGMGLQSMIVTRGIAEGARLTAHAGGDARTFAGLAGVGELVAALGIPDHPGLMRGLGLARGEPDDDLVRRCDGLLARTPDLPITYGVREVAAGRARVADAMAALMSRDLREERA